ncbi:T9SS type A sorting domain-containing protein [uncultured Draconibacterium sp.]|uniref:T9SS type A sorting domain-containing protein n=1 Tax=uncultured Draconibacterium sp. TaxID=1573823 RepID=UPI002AA65CAA|nr:T9SS type A sorting domain-containing protein [uncultured Draconibacterium sp.]
MKKNYLLFRKLLLFAWCFALLFSFSNARAQSIDKLEQFANGALKDYLMAPAAELSGTDWVTGNVNAAKAHYTCGMTIPYRLQASGLDPDSTYTVIIGYDITKGFLHAIDFLTSYDRGHNHPPLHIPQDIEDVVSMILVGTALENMTVSQNSAALPAPTTNNVLTPSGYYAPIGNTSGNPLDLVDLSDAGWLQSNDDGYGEIDIFNGTIVGVELIEGDHTGDTESEYLKVDFMVDPGQSIVVLAWGGDIACPELWGEGNSAENINGSPYHMFIHDCIGLSGCGNKEVQLSATAVINPPSCPEGGICADSNYDPAPCAVDPVLVGSHQYFAIPEESNATSYSWSFGTNTAGATFVGATDGSTAEVITTGNGTYTVIVTLSNTSGIDVDCEATIDVRNPAAACSVATTPASCFGSADGTATATVTPGTGIGPYSYTWTAVEGGVVPAGHENDNPLTGLVAGRYICTVVDLGDDNNDTQCNEVVVDGREVILICPNDTTVATCLASTEIETAFDEWMARGAVTGTDSLLTTNWDSVTYPDACGDTVTITWTLHDECANPNTCSATFRLPAPPAISIAQAPQDTMAMACDYDDQSSVETAFANWVANQEANLGLSGGCNPMVSSDADQVDLNNFCLGDTVTVNWMITDKCIDPIPASADFMLQAVPAISIAQAPQDTMAMACDYDDQSSVETAFANWVANQEANLGLSGGCNPLVNSDADQVDLNNFCLGDTVTVNWMITDKCIDPIPASADFMLQAVPAISIAQAPQDTMAMACDYDDQSSVETAFANWVANQEANLGLSGGCNPMVSSDADQVDLNNFCLGDTVTVNWMITDKCIDPIPASADFMLQAVPAISIAQAPQDTMAMACDYDDQSSVETAFANWVANQEANLGLSGGCNPMVSSDADQVDLNNFCLGDTVTVNWMITDKCIDPIPASADFMLQAVPAISIAQAPQDTMAMACDYDDQSSVETAFANWVANQEANLGLSGGCNPMVSSDADQVDLNNFCLGDTVTVNWMITDKCIDPIPASADFMLQAVPAISIAQAPQDTMAMACDYDDQSSVETAFANWVANQEANLGLSGGCNPMVSSDADQVDLNNFCLGDTVTVNWMITDKCIDPIPASADFMLQAVPAISVAQAPQDTMFADCSFESQAEVEAAFGAWVTEQETNLSLGGGCAPVLASDSAEAVLNDYCMGDTVTVTWTVNDLCLDEIEVSADFMWKGDHEAPIVDSIPFIDSICNMDPEPELWAYWTDNCGGSDSTSATPIWVEGDCPAIYGYTFKISDDCGNTTDTTVYVKKWQEQTGKCETVFGRMVDGDENVLIDFCSDGIFKRWGWTNNITEKNITYELDLYAGAAHCDITGREPVGTVEVKWSNDSVYVDYIMLPGNYLEEVHVYVGYDKYPVMSKGKKPKQTVAPGQYTVVVEGEGSYTSAHVVITNVVEDDFWIIAHGVACELTCVCFDDVEVGSGGVLTGSGMLMEAEAIPEMDGQLYKQHAIPNGPKKKSADIILGVEPVIEDGEFKVFPNPFDEVVNFEFVPAVTGHAVLEIHNMLGQRVVRLLDQPVEAGELQRVEFRPDSEISGMYLYKLDIDGDVRIGKLIYRNR